MKFLISQIRNVSLWRHVNGYSVGFSIGLLMVSALLISCEKKEESGNWKTTPYSLEIPLHFPDKLNILDDNPLTVEGVKLGRFLFYDGRLSGRVQHDSLMSCGSCHVQQYNFKPGIGNPAFTNGMPSGINGSPTAHAALPLINLVWNSNGYTWNGGVHPVFDNKYGGNLESIVIETIMHAHELAGDTSIVNSLFQNTPGYPELFYDAFGSRTVTTDRIAKAIAQFIRTLISSNSRFDQYMRGEIQLTSDELAGFILFTTEEGADCFHCHGSSGNPLFTTNLFYNNGKDVDFIDLLDRYSVTGLESDKGAYKATTLRNIAVSGPYMHDGRFRTLDEVIDFYAHQVQMSDYVSPLMHHALSGGNQLSPSEKQQLKAFLNSLTDEEFLNNPKFSAPQEFPDGKTYQDVRGKY
jgi:cytochrome c peroxidase